LAVKLTRQLLAGGTTDKFDTFMLATMTGSPAVPVSHEYRIDRISSGSSTFVRTSRPSATSSRKSVTWAPLSPPTLAAKGKGPVWAAGGVPGSGTVFFPLPVMAGPEI
jgi:hypothetical protein